MSPTDLRSIRTFPSLVKYLRDELEWPIETDDFDDLTFDYRPEELGIDPKTAASIEEIKQLRPLVANQPWGIFFIKFEPKRLPVVVLRRILRTLVIKKRASASKSHQATWNLHDLLFISSYGESDHRDITFAHFTEDDQVGDLPALRVLGWDDEDTVLHLEHAHKVLGEKLRWPSDPNQVDEWSEQWSSAFTLKHMEVITTSKDLAIQLARLSTAIRKRVSKVLSIETESGPLRRLMKAFKKALIHDLYEEAFADMYAQTITYGLLSARVSRPAALVAENITDMVPTTNPFLKDLLSTFLTVGGRKGNIDFDELGINEVVHALRDANMEAILRDFGDRNPQEDPVIHFYELFLKEYNPKLRMQRGVFYTPRPVVSFIVRSVDEILCTEFGLEDGLADTTTWEAMLKRFPEMKIPNGANPDEPFVQILDPALGTGTFLVEVIDIIHKTMTEKWQKAGHSKTTRQELWNEYVPKHLLTRLYGFELLMAPYAIAHMKIGLKLYETGYRFGFDQRAQIYLTNTLEPPHDVSEYLMGMAPALAHEAEAANNVKRHALITVVIGNPPYSLYTANLTEQAKALVDPYRTIEGTPLKERGALQLEKNLQDDYVKFIALGSKYLLKTCAGILGFVTNEGYVGNRTLRGMRYALLKQYRQINVVNLHGSASRVSKTSTGDKNVFDIQQGVAIGIFVQTGILDTLGQINHYELFGDRQTKFDVLSSEDITSMSLSKFTPQPEYFFFHPLNRHLQTEYDSGWPINLIFPNYSTGITTARDSLTIQFTEQEMLSLLTDFFNYSIEEARKAYDLGNDSKDWKVAWAQSDVREHGHGKWQLSWILYRPFDIRSTFYTGRARGFICNPRRPIMQHLLSGDNIALCTNAQVNDTFSHVMVTRHLINDCTLSTATRERTYAFPLYLMEEKSPIGFAIVKMPNLNSEFVRALTDRIGLNYSSESLPNAILWYIYSILHAPSYRNRYAEFLRIDFPRLPLTSSLELFRTLAKIGGELVALHLMESPKMDKHITKFVGDRNPEVEKISYSDETVWIDKSQATGFKGVPENIWNFHIGGYQVCEKWLKDRKGRVLLNEDITHYHKIVVALNETIRLMEEIDKVIDQHGGWPGAFTTSSNGSGKT